MRQKEAAEGRFGFDLGTCCKVLGASQRKWEFRGRGQHCCGRVVLCTICWVICGRGKNREIPNSFEELFPNDKNITCSTEENMENEIERRKF